MALKSFKQLDLVDFITCQLNKNPEGISVKKLYATVRKKTGFTAFEFDEELLALIRARLVFCRDDRVWWIGAPVAVQAKLA